MIRPTVPFKLEMNLCGFTVEEHSAEVVAQKLFDKALAIRTVTKTPNEKFVCEIAAQFYSLSGDAFTIAYNRSTNDERAKYYKEHAKQAYDRANELLAMTE